MLSKWWKETVDWWKHPYNSQGSAIQWFLFLGLVIICVIAWSRIIREIID